MDFDEFKILHSETIMYYQLIEHDLKLIYSYMLNGDIDENYDTIENITLGQMVKKLKNLDNSDGKPLISSGDYNFLSQICKNRNLWAHNCFSSFMYIENWEKSKEYKKMCEKLGMDHDRVSKASDILEDIRIKYCTEL